VIKLEEIKCSARRIDEKTVLLSCGEVFLKTDNKGVADMITILNRLLADASACLCGGENGLSQTIPRLDIDSKKSADEPTLVQEQIHPSYQTEIENKSRYRHQRNVVHLFSVASYKSGWPFKVNKMLKSA
jgi:hypothetical protein